MAKAKRKLSNVEFVESLMEFSDYGALAQAFVLESIYKWSTLIASKKSDEVETPLVSGMAWVGVATEIRDKIERRMKNVETPR